MKSKMSCAIKLVFLVLLLPALVNAKDKRYPEIFGLDEVLENCRESQKIFAIIQPISPMLIGAEVMKNPLADYCQMANEIVRDVEYARSLEKRGKLMAVTSDKWDQMQALTIAAFALNQSPIDFNKSNNETLEKAKLNAKRKANERYYKRMTGLDVADPNYSGDSSKENSMNMISKLSNMARKRAMIGELVKCPVPMDKDQKAEAEKLNELYSNEELSYELREMYYEQLVGLGALFGHQYRSDLRTLHKSKFKISYANIEKTGQRKIKIKGPDGEPTYKSDPYTYQVQKFKNNIDNEVVALDRFYEKYQRGWLDTLKYARDSYFGAKEAGMKCDVMTDIGKNAEMMYNGQRKGEKKFKYMLGECSKKMMESKDSYKKRFFENAFVQYRLWTVKNIKDKTALMTSESEVTRGPLIMEAGMSPASFRENENVCDRELSEAAIRKAKLESKYVSAEYRALVAELQLKKTLTAEQKQAREEESKKRAEYERKKRLKDLSAWDAVFRDTKKAVDLSK